MICSSVNLVFICQSLSRADSKLNWRSFRGSGQHGKLLTRTEPVASIIQEGLESYASGRITTQAELCRFFEAQPAFPKCLPNGKIRQQRVSDLLKRVVYAGYVEHAPWGVTRRKGHHEPIVSLETFQRIQARKNARPVAPARKDINEDFPLRGAVVCGSCDKPMTSCWSRSSTGKLYPYFFCHNRDCEAYRKNVRAEKIDTAFEEVTRALTPSRQLLEIAIEMFKDALGQRAHQAVHAKANLRRPVKALDKPQDALLARFVETTNAKVGLVLESKIAKLEDEKLVLNEKLEKAAQPRDAKPQDFESFMTNPAKPLESI